MLYVFLLRFQCYFGTVICCKISANGVLLNMKKNKYEGFQCIGFPVSGLRGSGLFRVFWFLGFLDF